MKKIFATMLLLSSAALLLTACQTGGESTSSGLSGKATDGGAVLNIHCWNNEFQGRFRNYSTDYVKTLEDGSDLMMDGTIVKWTIVANQNNAYQNALDEALLHQDSAAADSKVDLFLVEADYALKYVDSKYSLDVKKDIGLTDKELSNQYQYTKDIVTDSDGVQKGTTWQATPGLFAYRRDIAKEVLGSDDPATVQSKISTWDKFNTVAAQMKAKEKFMISGYDDAYRPFSNNVSAPWVKDGKVSIDPSIKAWIDQTKDYTTKGYSHGTTLWDGTWAADQGPAGNVFGFFYSTWGINFTLLGNSLATSVAEGGKEEVGNGLFGQYGVVEGPASFYWGGTWMCAAAGTDNRSQILNIMQDMTCSTTIAERLTRDTLDYTNNTVAMTNIATDAEYGSAFLGGQNHVALFKKSAEKIDMSNISAYDQGCNEKIQEAMKDYFAGTVTYEQALANFKTKLTEIYPALTYSF